LAGTDDAPPALVERLRHYFLTYKQVPGAAPPRVEITHVYDRNEAYDVINHSRADYEAHSREGKEKIAKTTT
jgi:inorganic pyrophosphatase